MGVGRGQAAIALVASTVAFVACFAAWVLNGVLVAFLVDNNVHAWSGQQMGLLIGAPVLTGALLRLPAGLLADRFGGRVVFTLLMLIAAVPMYLLHGAQRDWHFLLCGLGFGLTGASFAVGVAFVSLHFPRERQGTALGIFGVGNAGSGLTMLVAPGLLSRVTSGEAGVEGWRLLPQWYAMGLVVVALAFFAVTRDRKPESVAHRTLGQLLAPLRSVRVWRFGLYYFLVFGGFVALAQWLVPYYVNVYGMSLVAAGALASLFALPCSAMRAVGGWLADRMGPRWVLYRVLTAVIACSALLLFPRMEIESPGSGVLAARGGRVTAVGDGTIEIEGVAHVLASRPDPQEQRRDGLLLLPLISTWHEPVVAVGEQVARGQLLARGVTHIYFHADVWVFSLLVLLLGIAMGLGMGAVYKYIPDYFPNEVGVVGGLVGVVGGLGGFVSPIVFGVLLDGLGLWTATWLFLCALAVVCLVWLHAVVRRIVRQGAAAMT